MDVEKIAAIRKECRPRKWRNKESGDVMKAVPWLEMVDPVLDLTEDDGRITKTGFVTSLVQVGWMIENGHGVWFGVSYDTKDQFEEQTQPKEPKDE